MKYEITVELEMRNPHALEDIRERFEQLLLPEHRPTTLIELKKVTMPFRNIKIEVTSLP